jgi:hypothetical protein
MPTKKTTTTESVAVTPVRATKPKTVKASSATEAVSQSRVKSVKHSKAAAPVMIVESGAISAHDQIATIAYGYWEARGFEPGSPEQDWLRAEQEYLQQA